MHQDFIGSDKGAALHERPVFSYVQCKGISGIR